MNTPEQWTAAQYKERMQKLKMSQRHADKYRTGSANALTRSIVQWMNWNGFSVWRNNTMGVFDSRGAAKQVHSLLKAILKTRKLPDIKEIYALFKRFYRKSHERKGVSDVVGFEKKTGRFVAVEVKFGKDKLSAAQFQFLEEVRKNGGIAIVARDMEGFLKDIEQFLNRESI